MDKIIVKNYIFIPNEQKIVLKEFIDCSYIPSINDVALITCVDTNDIIFCPQIKGKGGILVDNVLTLEYDVSSLVPTYVLQIIMFDAQHCNYNVSNSTTSTKLLSILSDMSDVLKHIELHLSILTDEELT